MNIPSFQEALNSLHYNCDLYKVFTNNGKFKNRYSAYLALMQYTGYLRGPGVGEISIVAGTGMDMDKYGFRLEYTNLYGIYYFKNKKEIDSLTEERYNEIVYELQRQYKEYFVNKSLQKIQQDFD